MLLPGALPETAQGKVWFFCDMSRDTGIRVLAQIDCQYGARGHTGTAEGAPVMVDVNAGTLLLQGAKGAGFHAS